MSPAGSSNAPEARARQRIDQALTDAGWTLQDRDDMNLWIYSSGLIPLVRNDDRLMLGQAMPQELPLCNFARTSPGPRGAIAGGYEEAASSQHNEVLPWLKKERIVLAESRQQTSFRRPWKDLREIDA